MRRQSVPRPTRVICATAAAAILAAPVFPLTALASSNGLNATKQVQKNFTPLPSFEPLVKDVKPAVVSVIVHLKTENISYNEQGATQPHVFALPFPFPFGFNFHFAPPEHPVPTEALGSGFFISPKGYIVTNDHVVRHAKSVYVRLADGEKLKAKIVGTDHYNDLAVLKVTRSTPFPYLQFGNSKDVHPGQWVVAIGNPFGLSETVTAGIVSARGRYLGSIEHDQFIQTDAPINKGNSGGPLLNQKGQVIGVDTAILSPSGGSVGIGFSIPSDLVKRISHELIKHGHVNHGFLGVEVQGVSQTMAQALGLKSINGRIVGALIASVASNSPASRAGLAPGDVITKINGSPVTSVNELALRLSEIQPGSHVHLTYLRNGKVQHATATLEKRPKNPNTAFQGENNFAGVPSQQARLGLSLAPLSNQSREQLDIPDSVHGALITGVKPNSPADEAGLQAGDVILGVDHMSVSTPEQAAHDIHAIEARHARAVAFRIMRNNQTIFVAVPIPHRHGE